MEIAVIEEGPFATNTYLLNEGGRLVVVDPGFAGESVTKAVGALGAETEAVLVTHGHVDHVFSAMDVSEALGAPLYFPSADLATATGEWQGKTYRRPEGFRDVRDGDVLLLLGREVRVLLTPGHTPGEVSYLVGDILLSGDTLFAGTIGRSEGAEMASLIDAIRRHLLTLPDETRVLPGHGPATTIRAERLGNPFFIP